MPRGRPFKTEIRERIAALLSNINYGYGYELYKLYKQVFGYIGLRNFYYNLKKGIQTGEFIVADIKIEPGSFTWGTQTQHIYYALGPYANPINLTDRQKSKLGDLKPKQAEVKWDVEIDKQIVMLDKGIDEFHSILTRLKYEDKRKAENRFKSLAEQLKDWIKIKIADKTKASVFNKKIEHVLEKLEKT